MATARLIKKFNLDQEIERSKRRLRGIKGDGDDKLIAWNEDGQDNIPISPESNRTIIFIKEDDAHHSSANSYLQKLKGEIEEKKEGLETGKPITFK